MVNTKHFVKFCAPVRKSAHDPSGFGRLLGVVREVRKVVASPVLRLASGVLARISRGKSNPAFQLRPYDPTWSPGPKINSAWNAFDGVQNG